jgi:hypothetical protein
VSDDQSLPPSAPSTTPSAAAAVATTPPPADAAPKPPASPGGALPTLMAANANATAATAATAKPDLDAAALAAARQAIAAGEQALAVAAAQLSPPGSPPARSRRRSDLVFGVVLLVNLFALVAVASLPPAAASDAGPAVPPPPPEVAATAAPVAPKDDPELRAFNAPLQRALAAADRGEHASAVTMLEAYLAGTPSLQPSQQANVLNMLSHYASLANDFGRAQEFAQRAAGIGQAHSLPADLVAMAKAAAASGDQEALRRVWARFLLQQRQVPSWLYKHVAQAYLELGDSYRDQANVGAERERVRKLQEAAARLAEMKAGAAEAGK